MSGEPFLFGELRTIRHFNRCGQFGFLFNGLRGFAVQAVAQFFERAKVAFIGQNLKLFGQHVQRLNSGGFAAFGKRAVDGVGPPFALGGVLIAYWCAACHVEITATI